MYKKIDRAPELSELWRGENKKQAEDIDKDNWEVGGKPREQCLVSWDQS